ncbi:Hypothetical predicted protein [Cloeon dipterum]|uniref:Secreted protein n=1 Tax=Cloeon dipterum TaxID=197152 RepID=A0A8S1DUI0_9INSE|nr:Hypothetical predicted protein [Cloeon dipterum]
MRFILLLVLCVLAQQASGSSLPVARAGVNERDVQPLVELKKPGEMPEQVILLPRVIAVSVLNNLRAMVKGSNFLLILTRLGYIPLDIIAKNLGDAGQYGTACSNIMFGTCSKITNALVGWIENFKNGERLDATARFVQEQLVQLLNDIQV